MKKLIEPSKEIKNQKLKIWRTYFQNQAPFKIRCVWETCSKSCKKFRNSLKCSLTGYTWQCVPETTEKKYEFSNNKTSS